MIHCPNCSDKKFFIKPGLSQAEAHLCRRCVKVCPICQDTGYKIIRNEKGEDFAEICECNELKSKIRNFNHCAIPKLYWDAERDNFKDVAGNPVLKKVLKQTFKHIDELAKHPSKGLLFYGGVGTGKTRLLSVILKDIIFTYGRQCRFVEFTKLLSLIKQGYNADRPESEFLYPLSEIDVLAVDELGKGKGSDWENQILDDIITHRYNNRKLTFFTTNYLEVSSSAEKSTSPDKADETLRERVRPRIHSRLKEMCIFLKLDTEDYRPKLHISQEQVRI